MASRGGGRRGGFQHGGRGEPRPFQGPGRGRRGEPRPFQGPDRGDPRFFQGGGFQGGGGRGPYYGGGRGDPRSYQQPGGPNYTQAPYQQGAGRGGRGRGGGAAPQEDFPALPRAPPVAIRPPSSSGQSVTTALGRLSISETPASVSGTTEPALVPDAQSTVPPASSKAERFPLRPGSGSSGTKVKIRANHFLVAFTSYPEICHYNVVIEPAIASRTLNRVLIKELIRKFAAEFDGKNPAYDGRKNLYTIGKLPFESRVFEKMTLPEREGSSSNNKKEYSIKIAIAGGANLYHLAQFIKGKQMDCPQDTIQALDVVLRVKPSTDYTLVARSFFSEKFGRRDIGAGMECWKGYYQSLRPTQMGLSLNIDISATSFYKPILVTQFVEELLKPNNGVFRISRQNPSEGDLIRVRNSLKGIRVEVTHMDKKTMRYKITGITTPLLKDLMFEDGTGTMTSVVEYFMKTYGLRLELLHWPCLQAGSDSRPTYLPMEVCKIVKGQRYLRKLTNNQVTGILNATCTHPQAREESIHEMIRQNEYHNDEFAKTFGMDISPDLAVFEARVLEPPKLKYHETGRFRTCKPSLGQWNMIDKIMVNGGSVDRWACINFTDLPGNRIKIFFDTLVQKCNSIGMTFNPEPIFARNQLSPHEHEDVLRSVYRDSEGGLQLLLIILPNTSNLYGPIKRICETELGIVSQCCLAKHVLKNTWQYHENVSLKINVKVGGCNTVLADRIPFLNDKVTIIFGADVTHPAPGDDSQPSIAAVVASVDWPQVTKYRGLVSAQKHRKEIISDLHTEGGGMIREHLLNFLVANGRQPERIIFYRDGVSEGQFKTVLAEELVAIRKACRSLNVKYEPTVTFIVVQKRHHTRFFPYNYQESNIKGNILPGTVVDSNICHPTDFDFYLCSHAGIKGTSRPTHYYVLHDDNHFTADGLQELTYNLCYVYARCTRAVSVVPPAYYAHLAAFRARYYSDGVGGEERDAGVARIGDPVVRPLPRIKDNVKQVMFYC